MKYLATIAFFLMVGLAKAEPVVSLEYFNILRIPNHRVHVIVSSEGASTVITESKGKQPVTRTVQIPFDQVERLKRDLDRIDWKAISGDETKGADGTVARISYGHKSASLWSPDYKSRERGLSGIQNVTERVFHLSGLDKAGMPR